jgi:hypothetical protein
MKASEAGLLGKQKCCTNQIYHLFFGNKMELHHLFKRLKTILYSLSIPHK